MLRCTGRYTSGLGSFADGDVIDDPALCALLLNDAPEMFEVITERSVEDAPNRMVTKDTPKTRTRKVKAD